MIGASNFYPFRAHLQAIYLKNLAVEIEAASLGEQVALRVSVSPVDQRDLLSEVSSTYICAYRLEMCFLWIFCNIYLNLAVSAKASGSKHNYPNFHG